MPPKKFRKLVMESAQEYRWILHREDMSFKTSWAHEDKKRSNDETLMLAAEIDVDVRYLSAHMTVYPFVWKDWMSGTKTDEDIKKIVAHEIAHMTTQKVVNLLHEPFCSKEEAIDAWESLTETVGQLLYRLDSRKKKPR